MAKSDKLEEFEGGIPEILHRFADWVETHEGRFDIVKAHQALTKLIESEKREAWQKGFDWAVQRNIVAFELGNKDEE